MEENQITIVDEKGNEHLCEIIFTFDAEKFGKKSYVVFSPIGEVDEDGDQFMMQWLMSKMKKRAEVYFQSNLKKSGKWYKKCSTLLLMSKKLNNKY